MRAFNTASARALRTVTGRPFYAPRLFSARTRYAATTRDFHIATGQFINLGPDDSLVTKEVSIRTGEAGEAYVMIPTEIGYALQASISSLPKRPDKLALTFFHNTQHFALDSSPDFPRLVIPQQLPRQSDSDTSPATLYLFGLMHSIALDGTPDAEFTELASTIMPEIGEEVEKLKDM